MITRRAILLITIFVLLTLTACLPRSQPEQMQQGTNSTTATQPVVPSATAPLTAATVPATTPSATIILEDESVPPEPKPIEETPLTMDTTNPSSTNPATDQWTALAKKDLAQRLDINEDGIELLEARSVVWPDASLGCPQSGVVYAQSPVEGMLIRLSAEGRMYFYHGNGTQEPFLCEQMSQMLPKVTPKSDELIPPPGSDID